MAIRFTGDKDTKFAISVSARPSIFGYTLYNNAFAHLNINMIYKPFPADSEQQLSNIISGVRGLGIVGCSVSMPYKETVMKYLDMIDPKAQQIGAINTILNKDNNLIGYNTDYEGAKTILKKYEQETLLVLGTGGVCKAVIQAAKDCGMNITVTGRSDESLLEITKKFNVASIPWTKRNEFKSHMVINCTSVGMEPNSDELVVESNSLSNFSVVGDLVMKPAKSILICEAEKKGLVVIPGPEFMLNQFLHQFKIYTGEEIPEYFARAAINNIV